MNDVDMNEKLVFVISPPRSGSTMLDRILASHSAIYSRPEPQLIAPLFQLGYFGRVADPGVRDGTGAYHAELAALGIKGVVEELPRGEEDYLDALRAYLDVLYGRLLTKSGKSLFVDKTPRNALYVDFITRLFPKTRLVVLTRSPLAIAHSLRTIMMTGVHPGIPASDSETRVHREVAAFSRAVAACIRDHGARSCMVRYESLVADPDRDVARVCSFLGVDYEPGMIDYGAKGARWEGPGDPILVNQRTRPTTEALNKWVEGVRAEKGLGEFLRTALSSLEPSDIAMWGYDLRALHDELDVAIAASR